MRGNDSSGPIGRTTACGGVLALALTGIALAVPQIEVESAEAHAFAEGSFNVQWNGSNPLSPPQSDAVVEFEQLIGVCPDGDDVTYEVTVSISGGQVLSITRDVVDACEFEWHDLGTFTYFEVTDDTSGTFVVCCDENSEIYLNRPDGFEQFTAGTYTRSLPAGSYSIATFGVGTTSHSLPVDLTTDDAVLELSNATFAVRSIGDYVDEETVTWSSGEGPPPALLEASASAGGIPGVPLVSASGRVEIEADRLRLSAGASVYPKEGSASNSGDARVTFTLAETCLVTMSASWLFPDERPITSFYEFTGPGTIKFVELVLPAGTYEASIEGVNDDGSSGLEIVAEPRPCLGPFTIGETHDTIAEAIADACDLATIRVPAGTYDEAIDFAGKAIRIESIDGPDVTFLDGTGLDSSVVVAMNGEGADSVLSGFTIVNGTAGTPLPEAPELRVGGGLFAWNASPSIESCVFTDCAAPYGGGAYLRFSESILTECRFVACEADVDGGGAQSFAGDVSFVGCDFLKNVAQGFGGGLHAPFGSITLDGTTLEGNVADAAGGMSWYPFDSGDDLTIVDCVVANNATLGARPGDAAGIWIRSGFPQGTIQDSIVCENDPRNIVGPFMDLGGNDLCDLPGDVDGDGMVDGADLTLLLGAWGPCDGPCPADLDGGGFVDGGDLVILLGEWGASS